MVLGWSSFNFADVAAFGHDHKQETSKHFLNSFNQISDQREPGISHNSIVRNAADWPLMPLLPELTIEDLTNPKFNFK